MKKKNLKNGFIIVGFTVQLFTGYFQCHMVLKMLKCRGSRTVRKSLLSCRKLNESRNINKVE